MTILELIIPLCSAILGYTTSHFFFPKTITIEKEVIKEVPVKTVIDQCQVAEVITEGDVEYLKAWDYYNRKQVISKRYKNQNLQKYKNGDMFLYNGETSQAELDFDSAIIV